MNEALHREIMTNIDTLIARIQPLFNDDTVMKRYVSLFIQDLTLFRNMLEAKELNAHATCEPYNQWMQTLDNFRGFLTGDSPYYRRQHKTNSKDFQEFCKHCKLLNSALSHGDYNDRPNRIYYSQKVCQAQFKDTASEATSQFPFLGNYVPDAAEKLSQHPDLLIELTVRVYYAHIQYQSIFLALNNRGLATICLAKMMPLRVLPVTPSSEERKRIEKVILPLDMPSELPKAISHGTARFFREMNQSNQRAPFEVITGVGKEGRPMFSVVYYALGSDGELRQKGVTEHAIRFM